MTDDTIRAALTLDALVEEVARAIATRPGHECVCWTEGRCERLDRACDCRKDARAALAAVAKRTGLSADQLRTFGRELEIECCLDPAATPQEAALGRFFRTLAEAAP